MMFLNLASDLATFGADAEPGYMMRGGSWTATSRYCGYEEPC